MSEGEKKALQREQREQRLKERVSKQNESAEHDAAEPSVKPLGRVDRPDKKRKGDSYRVSCDDPENEPKQQRPGRAAKALTKAAMEEPLPKAKKKTAAAK